MRKLFILLFTAITLTNCNRNDESSTIIAGRVINLDSTTSGQVYLAPMEFNGMLKSLPTDLSPTNTTFHHSVEMTHRHNMLIGYQGEYYNLVASPGDSIFVQIDARSKEITFSGDNARFNNQLTLANELVHRSYQNLNGVNYTLPSDKFIEYILSSVEGLQQEVNEFCTANSVSSDVRNYLLDEALYTMYSTIINYDHENQYSPARMQMLHLDIFDIDNPKKMQTYSYFRHAMAIMNNVITKDPQLYEMMIDPNSNVGIRSKMALDAIMELPKSPIRDMMLAQIISGIPPVIGVQMNDERYLDPATYCNTRFLDLYIRPILDYTPEIKRNDSTDDFSSKSQVYYMDGADSQPEKMGRQSVLKYIGDRYAGKLVYLMVWSEATPMVISQVQAAEDLHEKFADRDVAFVNLALNTTLEVWQQSVAEHRIGGENYFVDDAEVSDKIYSQLKLSGYPTYILIGADGEIIAYSVFRPSQLDYLSRLLYRELGNK
ncbi:MAG: thioredoxin-like domain-containing protein [Rikenellaceae bacterium]